MERWARIETFVPENFWTLEMSIKLNADGSVTNNTNNNQNGNVYNNQQQSRAINLSWKRVRLYDRPTTTIIFDACLEAREAVVTSLTGRPKISGDLSLWQQLSYKSVHQSIFELDPKN